jgi:hypothetical protein
MIEFRGLIVGPLSHHCQSAHWAVLNPRWLICEIHLKLWHAQRYRRLTKIKTQAARYIALLLPFVAAYRGHGGDGQIATQAAIDVEFRKLSVGTFSHHRQSAYGAVLNHRWLLLGIHRK